jgi:hypothetical protein
MDICPDLWMTIAQVQTRISNPVSGRGQHKLRILEICAVVAHGQGAAGLNDHPLLTLYTGKAPQKLRVTYAFGRRRVLGVPAAAPPPPGGCNSNQFLTRRRPVPLDTCTFFRYSDWHYSDYMPAQKGALSQI